MNIRNPFEHFYPDVLTPEEVHQLYIKEYTEYNYLTAYKHTFVEGRRGSGKSMLFKYLEPACQRIEYGSWGEFLKQTNAFIGVFINCNTGDWKRKEYGDFIRYYSGPSSVAENLLNHEFVMRIAMWTLKTISEQLMNELKEDDSLFEKIVSSLDVKSRYRDKSSYPRTLSGMVCIISEEIRLANDAISNYLSDYSLPGNRLQHEGNIVNLAFADGKFLYEYFMNLRIMLDSEDIPFFLLFDEVSDQMLFDYQQKAINTLISQRIQNLVCVKATSRPYSYSTDTDIFDKVIQDVHDYNEIVLDVLYTNNRQGYYKRLIDITDNRMRLAGFKVTDIVSFLPERDYEKEVYIQAQELTAKEYDELPENKRPQDKNEYVNKYARARIFQKFLEKTSYWYTGFNNLVHFSAGVTRSFLDPCFDMVEKYIQKNPDTEITDIEFIPASIQKDVIREHSNSLVDKYLNDRIRRRDPDSEERRILQGLLNLIESLGKSYKIRLSNKSSRYPRIISFSIKGNSINDPELERVLKLGVQDGFFQRIWYRGKSGYEMLECYILNRKLCPRYGLDLSGFQGRIELSVDRLKQAICDTEGFVKWFASAENKGKEDDIEQDWFDV